jgi:hypothetical protein
MSSDLSDLDNERVVVLKSNWEAYELEGEEATGGILALMAAFIVFIRVASLMFMFALADCRLALLVLFLQRIFNAAYSL